VNVIHRRTLEYRTSVHTPDHPESEWKHGPDLSAVAVVPSRYWKAPADWDAPGAGPVQMTQQEKDAVDAQADADTRTSLRGDALASLMENRDGRALVIRAFARIVLDEINALRANAGLSARTWPQMVAAFQSKIQAGEGEV